MNIPENLLLADEQGRPRKNGEERKAINWLLECERERKAMTEAFRNGAVPGDEHGPYKIQNMRDHGFSEELITAPHIPTDRMTLQSSIRPEWSNAARPQDDDSKPGDVKECDPPSADYVLVKGTRGWWMERRETAHVASMVAEDEATGNSGEPA